MLWSFKLPDGYQVPGWQLPTLVRASNTTKTATAAAPAAPAAQQESMGGGGSMAGGRAGGSEGLDTWEDEGPLMVLMAAHRPVNNTSGSGDASAAAHTTAVIALTAGKGQLVWSRKLNGSCVAPMGADSARALVVAHGHVVMETCGDGTCCLRALNLTTGARGEGWGGAGGWEGGCLLSPKRHPPLCPN